MSELTQLETQLSAHSHSEDALKVIEEFACQLNKSATRIAVFNADNALVRAPILAEDARVLGFDSPDDDFALLQGDLVSTESAYFLGGRVTGAPKYVVLGSSCDLVRGRRKYASLLRVAEIRKSEPEAKTKLDLLLRFRRRDAMYLPVLPTDPADVVCNVINFDGLCQIEMEALLLANRIASLSLVGWRMFASFTRIVFARANPREVDLRRSVEGLSPGSAVPSPRD